jgi:hypothetical protein
MKKKLVRIANQIIILEEKLQNGENMRENLETMEKLTNSLSEKEFWEVNQYIEEKLGFKERKVKCPF